MNMHCLFFIFFLSCLDDLLSLHSFPTRRSSDLIAPGSATITATSEGQSGTAAITVTNVPVVSVTVTPASASIQQGQDRKSTRLNSSHQIISYAVFCLKKKTDTSTNRVR